MPGVILEFLKDMLLHDDAERRLVDRSHNSAADGDLTVPMVDFPLPTMRLVRRQRDRPAYLPHDERATRNDKKRPTGIHLVAKRFDSRPIWIGKIEILDNRSSVVFDGWDVMGEDLSEAIKNFVADERL
jgi:hypothetical protein